MVFVITVTEQFKPIKYRQGWSIRKDDRTSALLLLSQPLPTFYEVLL